MVHDITYYVYFNILINFPGKSVRYFRGAWTMK